MGQQEAKDLYLTRNVSLRSQPKLILHYKTLGKETFADVHDDYFQIVLVFLNFFIASLSLSLLVQIILENNKS